MFVYILYHLIIYKINCAQHVYNYTTLMFIQMHFITSYRVMNELSLEMLSFRRNKEIINYCNFAFIFNKCSAHVKVMSSVQHIFQSDCRRQAQYTLSHVRCRH